jgi:hypothetical protein
VAADCDDGHACTTDACTAGVCANAVIPGCTECATDTDCNDGHACTTDACTSGICANTAVPGCQECSAPTDCTDDGNACTTPTCEDSVCGVFVTPGCQPCETAADCNDGHACTADSCNEGVCVNTSLPDCQECETANDCNDDNGCTTELCTDGACGHTNVPGCVPCESASDCNDENACTTDTCGADGSCQITTIPGCVPCETAADCNDDDACTTDTCSAGVCAHETIANCPAEVCDDGIDNDGDGQVDCADSDCANNPVCKVEICGNCIDDDGDGLVDFEDPDCCDQTNSLVISRMTVRTKPQLAKNKLRLKARYAARAPEGFDPMTQGTTLEMRDADGNFFCQQIPLKTDARWLKMGVWKLKDRTGLTAGGIRRAKFKMQKKHDNRVMFRTRGKKMSFRDPVGTEVTVTLAVGNQCTTQVANLKTRKGVKNGKALVFKPVKTK